MILLVISGEKEIQLKVSGIKKGGFTYIRCKDIQALDIRPYSVSAFAAINPFYPREGDEGEYIVILPGYKGEGILLRYTYESLFSQQKKSHTILFPTNNAQGLVKILKDIIKTGAQT